jgi:hypothetical protein
MMDGRVVHNLNNDTHTCPHLQRSCTSKFTRANHVYVSSCIPHLTPQSRLCMHTTLQPNAIPIDLTYHRVQRPSPIMSVAAVGPPPTAPMVQSIASFYDQQSSRNAWATFLTPLVDFLRHKRPESHTEAGLRHIITIGLRRATSILRARSDASALREHMEECRGR